MLLLLVLFGFLHYTIHYHWHHFNAPDLFYRLGSSYITRRNGARSLVKCPGPRMKQGTGNSMWIKVRLWTYMIPIWGSSP
ncbi:hypothetical protein F4859DRAFT_495047 [Xylaria cf. heliscus]|nr:hypothetical protein F4859DRAFT_495047 [Xylaria cf. heliscus]